MSLRKRLERLEGTAEGVGRSISREALKTLSDEDLDALEEALDSSAGDVSGERYRQAVEAYCAAVEAVREEVRRGEVRPEVLDIVDQAPPEERVVGRQAKLKGDEHGQA